MVSQHDVYCSRLVNGGIIGPHAQAFHRLGSEGRSSSALHGTVLCASSATSDKAMRAALRVVRRRLVRGFGDSHAQVARLGKTCILVAFDRVTRRPSVLAALAAPGYVALTDSRSTQLPSGRRVTLSCMTLGPDCPPGSQVGASNLEVYPDPVLQIVVPGTYVKPGSARVDIVSTTGQPTVFYTLIGKGRRRWCAFTSSHVGSYSAIVLDNVVISDPLIQEAICGGQTQIAGLHSVNKAKQLALFLNYGAHPVTLHAAGTQ